MRVLLSLQGQEGIPEKKKKRFLKVAQLNVVNVGMKSDFFSLQKLILLQLDHTLVTVPIENQTDILYQGLGPMFLLLSHLFQGIFSLR